MQIDGRFWLTKEGQNFLGTGRIKLLEFIDKTGSINAAAKEMKMSYKAAWERLNGMNLLAEHPLIERSTGGKGGGGTTLTPYARELITTYRRFDELHRQFIDRFSEASDDPERLARILSRTFLTTSARNQLPARLESMKVEGLHTILSLKLEGSDTLYSTITAKSVHSMGLEEGCELYAIIKSSDIRLSEVPSQIKEDNSLEGMIEAIERSDENIEISFRLQGGGLLIALINATTDEAYSIGQKCYALISSKNIIIGL